VTVTNNGSAALHVTKHQSGRNRLRRFHATSDTCTGATVAVNATCMVGVTFTPGGPGRGPPLSKITDDATGSPQTLALMGNGLAAATRRSPSRKQARYSFQTRPKHHQRCGDRHGAKHGERHLEHHHSDGHRHNAGDFAISANTCNGAALAANATCTVGITFTPTATGMRTATLQFGRQCTVRPQSVTLTGMATAATAPAVTFTPATPLVFPTTAANATSER